MADKALLHILRKGDKEWNEWRREHPEVRTPDLSRADLSGVSLYVVNLRGANLSDANLSHAILPDARLDGADLTGADLTGADIHRADFPCAILRHADLTGANLTGTDFSGADLTGAKLYRTALSITFFNGANLTNANLCSAQFSSTDLSSADLTRAELLGADISSATLSATKFEDSTIGHTSFGDVDLRGAEGLETVRHLEPSNISLSAIYRSEGEIPEAFLLGCGVPESFITQIPALVGAMQPIQFYSCFISYSSRDEEFAKRLHARMREAELRVWFAPEDMKGGDKLYEQIDRAIQVHDRLLLVLSESSMRSRWVETEIRRARKVELKEGRRKLFPIRLVSYEALQEWVCIDSATGEDLAEEVRGYFIPDFSNWKNHDDFERAFSRLLADLKASA